MRLQTQAIPQAIPVNLITGFLGSGKTTVIQRMLLHKPAQEHWAVLINEFGEIGIDESLLRAQTADCSGLTLRQIPGGCLCCSAGLSLQVALHQIIRRLRPDRILIEPTGLGHPRALLESLHANQYQGVLKVHTTLSLLDARQLSSQRHLQHPIFNEQLSVADVIVAHKSDTYTQQDQQRLRDFLLARGWQAKPLCVSQWGDVPPAILDYPAGWSAPIIDNTTEPHLAVAPDGIMAPDAHAEFSEQGVLRRSHAATGYYSLGWLFSDAWIFDSTCLQSWLTSLAVERAKGVFRTPDGLVGYNGVGSDRQWFSLSLGLGLGLDADEHRLNTVPHSRLELIHNEALDADALESALLECRCTSRPTEQKDSCLFISPPHTPSPSGNGLG